MRRSVLVVSLICAAAPAFAGGNQDGAAAPPADAGSRPTDLEHYGYSDAADARAYFGPTALTDPAGTVTLGLRQSIIPAGDVSVSAALSDRVEVGAGLGYLLFTDEAGFTESAQAKVQLVRGDQGAVAVMAGAYQAPESTGMYVGAIASMCLDRCAGLATVWGAFQSVSRSGGMGDAPAAGGASLLLGDAAVRVIVEGDAALTGTGDRFGLLMGGVRILGHTASFDLGLATLLYPHGDIEVPIMVLAAVSTRL